MSTAISMAIPRPTQAILILSSCAINTVMLAMPLATLQIYDRVLTHPQTGTLPMLAMGVLTALVLETALRLARSRLTSGLTHAYELSMSTHLVAQVMGSWVQPAQRKHYGEYLQALGALGRMRDYALQRLIAVSVDVPYLLLFLVALWLVGGMLVMVPLLAVLAFGAAVLYWGSRLRTAIHARNAHDQQRYGFMLESLAGAHAIKALGMEPRFITRYHALQRQVGGDSFRIALLNHALAGSGAMFSQAMVVMVVACGAPLVLQGALSMGALIACVLLSGRLIQPLQHGLSCWMSYQEFEQAVKQYAQVADLPLQPMVCSTSQPERDGHIEVSQLAFRYDDANPLVLQQVNLTVEAGEAVAITAEGNAGRSTMLKLIGGLYQPTSGIIRVDGVDPAQMLPFTLSRHIGYLSSDAVLLRGTIMQNLSGFDPAMEARALELSRLIGLDQLVAKLPAGYETQLDGSGADVIPPGMRQRVCIARALRHKPKLILFDQADRSLDREGYHQLFSLLARLKGKASMLIVSDDQNLMRLCDRRLQLHAGVLRPTGDGKPHLTLVNSGEAA